MIEKAVIPAAGLGTRFLPATKAQPKEMLPVVDKPVIQYVVEEALSSGIKDIPRWLAVDIDDMGLSLAVILNALRIGRRQ
jgi:CTP:molybdopterin cytidylyltransferase MocA